MHKVGGAKEKSVVAEKSGYFKPPYSHPFPLISHSILIHTTKVYLITLYNAVA